MQIQTRHLLQAITRVVLGVMVVGWLCFAVLTFVEFHSTTHADVAGASLIVISGSAQSSPSAGPAGTVITVSGSGWMLADGIQVTFGYLVGSKCSVVADSQNGTLNDGNFRGWFRWPAVTTLNTYQVCAMPGNRTALAGSFSVQSITPPGVSISPSALSANQQATITASNFYPAGTLVNFAWVASDNTVIDTLNSALSDANGVAVLSFPVPNFLIAGGSYIMQAYVGNGQPPTLFASTGFTFNAPVVPPSPTPAPKLSPTPSPAATQTSTATTTPTTRASATATTGATPTATGSQAPTTNGTTSGNNSSGNTGTPATSSSSAPLLFLGVAGLLILLFAGTGLAFMLSHRRKAARKVMHAIPPGMPVNASQVSWSNSQGAFMNNMPVLAAPPAMPVQVGTAMFAGSVAPPPTTQQQPITPPAWLTMLPAGGTANVASRETTSRTLAAANDPVLEAMRQQVQSGLFAAPGPYKDERNM
ncbi:MAG TPA: hypothetical protein VNE38_14820 [Ktedonobacteraceae bacterium]|nr:hypothetical protein [Ktedonobacteraceae bacterium]